MINNSKVRRVVSEALEAMKSLSEVNGLYIAIDILPSLKGEGFLGLNRKRFSISTG